MSDALPVALNRELGPGAGEDFADIYLVIVSFPVFIIHPPVTVIFELIVKLLSQSNLIVPSLIFIAETTIPLTRTRTPRIANVKKLKWLLTNNVFYTEQSVGVIESNSIWASTFLLLAIFSLLRVSTTNKISIFEVHFHLFPEDTVFKSLSCLWSFQIKLLRDSSRYVNHSFTHLSTVKHLKAAMQLSISFFDEWNPKFLTIYTAGVQWLLVLGAIRNARVNDHKLPFAVLKETEY